MPDEIKKVKTIFSIARRSKEDILAEPDHYKGRLFVSEDTNEIFNDNGTEIKTISNQVLTMPAASSVFEDLTLQYIGATDSNYINGMFYTCVKNGTDYLWQVKSTLPILTTVPDSNINNLGLAFHYNGTSTTKSGFSFVKGSSYQCVYKNNAYTYEEIGGAAPVDNMYGGTYTASTTYTDGKIRFEPQNDSKVNNLMITYLDKRTFLLQGSFSCSRATVNNWFTIGYWRFNNQRMAWPITFETVGCDGNLNPALVRFNNSYNDFRYIITKTPMSSTLYINTVVRTKIDLY